jgi:hypothetical protein
MTQTSQTTTNTTGNNVEGYYNSEKEATMLLTVRSVVSKYVFNDQQFISCNEHECFGSPWQKEVCQRANVQEKHAKAFWNKKGMVQARVSLNRKRQNTTTAMKKHFWGKKRQWVSSLFGFG